MRFLRLYPIMAAAAVLASCTSTPKAPDPAALEAGAYARIQAIPAADSKKYGEVENYKTWQNPYLIIRKDGVGLLDVANHEERWIKLEELPAALADLPAAAWPYGRVVAVTENGIRTSGDNVLIRKNRGIVLGTLESMHILVSIGPPSG
ncbi:MAG: hypothetical protein ACRD20_14345 [Terriglobales bacterium]